MAKEKQGAAKSKRAKRKKPASQKWKHYKIEGDKVSRARSCPRCGPGVFLANSGSRLYCGKCHYTEFVKAEIAAASK